ncbi:MAG: hypothetical protein RIM80_19830, partial [Alphaproteobacteria bacterium]
MTRAFLQTVAKAGALAGAFALGLAGAAQAVEIKGAHYLSPKHPLGVGYDKFEEVVEKESGGDVQVRIFAGGALLTAKAIADGVRDGVADFGTVVMTYTPAYFPHGLLMGDLA